MVIRVERIRGLHVPLVSPMVIQLTWQSAGEIDQSAFLALMGIPIPVYASPTVSRMVICLEWLKEACMCIW